MKQYKIISSSKILLLLGIFAISTLIGGMQITVSQDSDNLENIIENTERKITILEPSLVGTLNWFTNNGYYTELAIEATGSSLLRFVDGKPGVLTTDLATSWTQIDESIYVFEIRDNARFSDGSDVTPEAVVRSLEFTADYLYFGFESVRVLNDNKVELTIKPGDFRYFWMFVTSPIFSMASNLEDDYLNQAGPYMFDEYNLPNYISVVKNPYYWDAKNVMIDRLTFEYVADPEVAIELINSGEPVIIDQYYGLHYGLWNRRGEIFAPYKFIPSFTYQELAFNNSNPNLDEPCERRAISSLIDRQGIIDTYKDGLGVPAATAWGPSTYGYDPNVPLHPDPNLPGCGPDGNIQSNSIDYPTVNQMNEGDCLVGCENADMTFIVPEGNQARIGWATEIVETLNANGYCIDLVELSIYEAFYRLTEGRYDGSFTNWGRSNYPGLEGLFGSDWNFYNYYNPEFDVLSADFARIGDVAIASQIQQLLHADEPTATLFYDEGVIFYSDQIKGIPFITSPILFYDWTNLYLSSGTEHPYAIEKLQELKTSTDGLSVLGEINKGQMQSLQAKIDGALDKVETGGPNQLNTAINKLEAYVNELQALVQSGQLTQEDINPLLDLVTLIINDLQN